MKKTITSFQNPLLKKIKLLQEKSRERKVINLFVFEGYRELQLALKGNYTIKTILCCESFLTKETSDFLTTLKTIETIIIPPEIRCY